MEMIRRARLKAALAGAAAILAAAAATFLAGCSAPRQDQWVREALAESSGPEAAWTRYHWYYPEITFAISAHWSNDGGYSGPLLHMTMRVAAKALTQEGASMVGALDFGGWNGTVKALEVIHLDSAGRNVQVPMAKVRATFKEKGIIVVPQVAKGSTVSVRIVRGPFSSVDWWELPMDRSVPVLKSQVKLTAGKGIAFDTKAYNGLEGPVEESNGRFRAPTKVWTAREVMPLAYLPYADAARARPRFLITNRNNAHGNRLATWESVARHKRKNDFDLGLLNLSGQVRAKAKTLAEAHPEDTARARAVLAFVQDRIAVTAERTPGLGLDAVLESRKGSEEQVAALLAALYAEAGLKAHIVLTRSIPNGGLDPEAPNPNAAADPLVIVEAGGKEYATYSRIPTYPFGDYPNGYMGQKALSLETGKLRDLPEARHQVSRAALLQEVEVEAAGSRKASVVFEGPVAAESRSRWVEGLAGDPLDACRLILSSRGFNASIRKCTQQGLEEREKPFRLELTLEDAGTWIQEDTATTWTAPDLFARPAWFYDSARTDAYYLPHDQVQRETVAFKTPAGRVPRAHIPCKDMDNAFMAVSCRWENPTTFTRETVLRKGRYSAADLKALHADLAGLDRIRETRLALRKR